MGRGQSRRRRRAGGRTTCVDGVMRTNEISAGSTRPWNQTHCISGRRRRTIRNPTGQTLSQQRLSAQQREQNLAKQIAATRIWTINRKTGDVSYMLNGRVSVIDRGRLVTVLNQDEAAIVFGLEMAVQKYGSRIACTGSEEWKRMVTWCAIKHGIFAQFTDPEMQGAFHQEQLLANPLQLRAVRLHSIETRLRTEETEDLIFTDETDARLLLSSLQPAAQSRQLLEILKASQQPEPKANVGGNLTIALVRSSTGQQAFKVSIHEGKRQEIIDRVAQLRQTAYLASRNNFRMLSNERVAGSS
jgi:hypothetical protein